MSSIHIEEKYIIEYIKDLLSDFRSRKIKLENAKYHHNTSYETASSIINHGILSLKDIDKLGIKEFNSDWLKIMGDTESHINGNNGISLSVVGLQDLYRDEFEYCPFNMNQVDFIVTSDVKAGRNSTHYGNEFISYERITPTMLRAVDVRLLECIKKNNYNEKDKTSREILIKTIDKYNCLKNIALSIKENFLDIEFREMSDDNNSRLDVEKISETPTLILKNTI